MKLLITGGCGFIGARLCTAARGAGWEVHAVDNLRRRGSELNLHELQRLGVRFHHADVRCSSDLDGLPAMDAVVIAAAESSVSAGITSSPVYATESNLAGMLRCLEKARQWNAAVMLLSSSRVYSIPRLRALAHLPEPTRFCWKGSGEPGFDAAEGISEAFSTAGYRSIYGSTKLASELLLEEYQHAYGLRTLVNRCSLIAGPGQMARSDQGVVALWVARHVFRQPLRYTGFDGQGRQVRDVLHVDDLVELLMQQLNDAERWSGAVFNVGGGMSRSASLMELTKICEKVTGTGVEISSDSQTSLVDIPIFVTDDRRVRQEFTWRAQNSVEDIVRDIYTWITEGDETLHAILGK